MNFIVPAGYTPDIDLKETQIAIKVVKDFFQKGEIQARPDKMRGKKGKTFYGRGIDSVPLLGI